MILQACLAMTRACFGKLLEAADGLREGPWAQQKQLLASESGILLQKNASFRLVHLRLH